MAEVVSVSEIASLMKTLGWTTIAVPDVVSGLQGASIPASEFLAYLNAAVAALPTPASTVPLSPATPATALDDQAITGCTPAHGTQITNYLKNHGVVTT